MRHDQLSMFDLFSGIGGFSHGMGKEGVATLAFCEKDDFCRKVLRKHWGEIIPIFEDITRLDEFSLSYHLPHVDIIAGGFPCQPFSTASRGRVTAKSMWPDMLRVIDMLQTQYVVIENVAEAPMVLCENDLVERGYNVWRKRIGAHDAGADHKRDRWWICAYTDSNSKLNATLDDEASKLSEVCAGLWGGVNLSRALRVSNGVPGRLDRYRVKALGNAVIPEIPQMIARAIKMSR